MTRLSIWNDLRPFSVGFDELFDHFNNTLEYTVKQPTSYPPYNINKVDDLNYQIEMALAGFSKKDIEIKSALSQLTIKSVENDDKDEKETLKKTFIKEERNQNDLNYTLSLIKKYDIINRCYQKAKHYINLSSNSLSVFKDSDEKNILENLTSFSLSRNF